MPRQFYTDKQRSDILSTVSTARKGRQKWAEIHKLVQNGGFRGGLQALMVYVNKAKKKARKAARSGTPVESVKAEKTAQMVPVRAAAAANGTHGIQDAIERLVQDRVRAALEKAIEALKGAM